MASTHTEGPGNDGDRGERVNPEDIAPMTDITDNQMDELEGLSGGLRDRIEKSRKAMEDGSEAYDDMRDQVKGASASAVASESESKRASSSSRVTDDDGFVMPELSEVMQNSEVAKGLSEEDRLEAYQEAKDLDFTNALDTMKFGLEEQKKASEVTRDFIEEVRGTDLEELTRLASENNQRMEELNIGELKPGFLASLAQKFLPSKRAEAVRVFLDKHKKLSDLISEGEQGMADERVKLEIHHSRMNKKIHENTEIYNKLGKKIAAAEMSYAGARKHTEELKEQYEGGTDAAKAREIALLDSALSRQARRVNTLKASRQETLNALRTMDLQLQGIESQIAMIDEQAAFNRLVWDNSVLMAATDKRMKNSVDAVQYNRKQIERMLKNRSGSIAETLQAIVDEQGEGVVNAAVLEYAAQQLLKMNTAIIQGNKDIREKMGEADQVIERIDKLVKDVAAEAAAMSEEDIEKLDLLMEEVGSAIDEADVDTEEEASS